ncbi:MAG: hypothetical protein V3T54_01190 [Acidobacteriota bacterium]
MTHLFAFGEIVGGDQDGFPSFPVQFLHHEIPEPFRRRRIQAPGGFIQEQQRGIMEKGPGDRQPLAHSRGVAQHRVVRLGPKIHQIHHLADPLQPASAGQAVQTGEKIQVFAPGQAPVQTALVGGDDAHAGTDPTPLRKDVVTINPGVSSRLRDQAGQDLDQGGFPRPNGPQ